ncbi:MAG TPA: peptidoglycan bridge formation glycyltransferase FemA/FemB family protein [Aeromicrobium sp.]|nr:peptidoglycan bridge formation glycyltransferase FemA/FemB family protein [Aeromicrobium sp.]
MLVTTVRPITVAEHLAFIATQGSVSFLQTPAWAAVKSEWRGESLGWFDANGALIGAGLVLYRKVPKLKRFLAYLPEGPALDWMGPGLDGELVALKAYLESQRAFAIRMGPPVVTRRWHAPTLKTAVADPALTRLDDVPADESDTDVLGVAEALVGWGWRRLSAEGGFAAGQPRHNFWVPLVDATGDALDDDALLAGMNQQWRRNIRKADKEGVAVHRGARDDLADFHRIYAETAERDQFTPRPLGYFERMWDALTTEAPDRLRLYLAQHDGDLVAATTMVQVGTHAWYSYGASTTKKREVRGSNAIQWQMMRDARDAGAVIYDMRGITDTVSADDPHAGLLQFKLGTGGQAVEYLGEWDLPLKRGLYTAFMTWMKWRSGGGAA